MSMGSVFTGWMMHATGRYKTINLIFGVFPFIGAVLIYRMREDSGPIQSWLSIVGCFFLPIIYLPHTQRFIDPSWFWQRCRVTNFAQ